MGGNNHFLQREYALIIQQLLRCSFFFECVNDCCYFYSEKNILSLLFLCFQRNFGRHIVISLSVRQAVRPASCPVHISYIL